MAKKQTATAGFRNAEWTMGDLPEGTQASAVALRTQDGAACSGFLFWRGTPRTVVCIMHPREFLVTHYLIPAIVEAGCAAWTQTSRSVGNDLRLEHEVALLDVAAGLVHLRGLGFARIALIGNSGGASLYTFYNQQALLAPERRLARTPGGRPTGLAEAEMPAPDAFVYVAPHPGQGKLLLRCIDPSVSDERDATSVDPTLDPFAAANGFSPPPQGARYAPAFVARYRAAQEARVARLDHTARAMIEERLAARRRAKEGGSRADRIAGAHTPVMTVWRTDADLRAWDLSLDPSERRYGSVWGQDPLASNYGAIGFARFCTPEAWLSTWSGLSSRATMIETLASVEQPVLMLDYTGDNTIFPEDIAALTAAIRTSDKRRHSVRGDHHGRALAEGEPPGRIAAGRLVTEWLREKCAG
jgi:hypothetical protein